tara:strand:- start:85 stop:786 length:702 start_codon:yes stop_codon:yes gene_type:complete
MFSGPEPIDLNKVAELQNNRYKNQLADQSASMLDPNSALNQALKQNLKQSIDQNAYTQNRLTNQNIARTGLSNQLGISAQLSERNAATGNDALTQAFNRMILANRNQGMTGLSQVMGAQQRENDTLTSAYGQNITNSNNFKSAMTGNLVNTAATAGSLIVMCDARTKKNIKRVGHAKASNGKKVGIYEFSYKHIDKPHKVTGVMAQDVEKKIPGAIKKGKNGLKFVDLNKVFG